MKLHLTNDEVFQMLADRAGIRKGSGQWVMHVYIDRNNSGGVALDVEFEPYDQKLHAGLCNAPPLLRLVEDS